MNGAGCEWLWPLLATSKRERRPVVLCLEHRAEMGTIEGCSLAACGIHAHTIQETPAPPPGFRRRGRCAYCSAPLYYAGRGRPPRFCRRSVCPRRRRDGGFAGGDPRRRNSAPKEART
jgi:hypothetical protein